MTWITEMAKTGQAFKRISPLFIIARAAVGPADRTDRA